MSFIGVITNSKNEEYIIEELSKKIPSKNIIFITDKNIENVKNIRFETLVIDKKINDIKHLKQVASHVKYVILNSDLSIDFRTFENLDLTVITYGFNSKATLTVSSVSENSLIICLQRIIGNVFGEKYDPQEFETKIDKNIDIYAVICVQILLLIYRKIHILTT